MKFFRTDLNGSYCSVCGRQIVIGEFHPGDPCRAGGCSSSLFLYTPERPTKSTQLPHPAPPETKMKTQPSPPNQLSETTLAIASETIADRSNQPRKVTKQTRSIGLRKGLLETLTRGTGYLLEYPPHDTPQIVGYRGHVYADGPWLVVSLNRATPAARGRLLSLGEAVADGDFGELSVRIHPSRLFEAAKYYKPRQAALVNRAA